MAMRPESEEIPCGDTFMAIRPRKRGNPLRGYLYGHMARKRGYMNKRYAYLGLLAAAAMILGYVESLLPVFAGVPGIKLGLPNLAIVMVLYLYSWKEALLVSLVRILGIGFLFGNLFSIAFSLAGGAVSLLCMELARRYLKLSCVGVSMVGGVAHNAGQIAVAVLVVENMRITYYFPILAVSGLVTGVLIGLLGGEMVRRMQRALPWLRDQRLDDRGQE